MTNPLSLKSLIVLGAALGLAACSEETAPNFFQPAGAFLDEGQFGNATMQNQIAQKCAGQAKGYIVPEPVVVLDPASPKSPQVGYAPAPRYGYARCSGNLNGKYAKIVFEEYVDSATELPPEKQSGVLEVAPQ